MVLIFNWFGVCPLSLFISLDHRLALQIVLKDREKGEAELRAKKSLNCEKKKNYKFDIVAVSCSGISSEKYVSTLFFPIFFESKKKNGKRIFVEEREKYFHCQTAVRTHTHQTEPSTLAITWNRPRNVQKAATSIFPPSGHYSGLNTHLIDL